MEPHSLHRADMHTPADGNDRQKEKNHRQSDEQPMRFLDHIRFISVLCRTRNSIRQITREEKHRRHHWDIGDMEIADAAYPSEMTVSNRSTSSGKVATAKCPLSSNTIASAPDSACEYFSSSENGTTGSSFE